MTQHPLLGKKQKKRPEPFACFSPSEVRADITQQGIRSHQLRPRHSAGHRSKQYIFFFSRKAAIKLEEALQQSIKKELRSQAGQKQEC